MNDATKNDANMNDTKNRNLVVTGASRGIGAATAILAANNGWRVLVNYHASAERAHEVVEKINADGGFAVAHQGDISAEQDVVSLFEFASSELGPVTGLINNAGTLETQMRLDEMSAERIDRVFATNVRGSFLCMLADLGVEQIDLGVVPDNREAIADVVRSAASQADLVITTAGASVGDADYIKDILTSLGQVSFWKVAIKPGRPLSFGKLGESLFFGLPGNPVSVMVTFQIFVIPALRLLSGETQDVPVRLKMRTMTALRKKAGRMEYQRGVMSLGEDGETVVRSTGEQGSGILSSMSQANCFIILPDDSQGAQAGEWVEVQPFSFT